MAVLEYCFQVVFAVWWLLTGDIDTLSDDTSVNTHAEDKTFITGRRFEGIWSTVFASFSFSHSQFHYFEVYVERN